jgi:predicted RNA-binding Zn ribbon-like protein
MWPSIATLKRDALVNVKKMRSATDEELIERFAQLAIIHRELRTAKEANKAFRESIVVLRELTRRGAVAVEKFLLLLEASNPAVRLSAAGNALFIAPERAESVLEELTGETKFIGISATMTLREWRAGRLTPLT